MEKTGDGETKKGRCFKKQGVSAAFAASGHIGKDRDLVIELAPWRPLVPLQLHFFKGL